MKANRLLLVSLLMVASQFSMADAASDVSSRQEIFKGFKKQMGIMGNEVKSANFNQGQFLEAATQLEKLSTQPWSHFSVGSNGGDTEAKPVVWSKPAEFKKAADAFVLETLKLKKVATNGKLEAMRAQLGATGATCKACHDSFKQ